jgi:hypothetical protein
MEKQLSQALGEYTKAHEKAKKALAEFPEIVAMLEQGFTKLTNPLNVRLGLAGETQQSEGFPTITKLAGQTFEEGKKQTVQTPVEKVKTADQLAAEELTRQVDTLLPEFLNIESGTLLDENPDMVLRGIAKRAGLPVTEEEPAKMSVKYIDEIKEALKPKELEL